jgi:tetratricopeptide (TPR) repeat protein
MSDGGDPRRPNVVAFERTRRRPDPARVLEFAETARRLQREREDATDVVTRALRETPREEWSRLATRPDLRNSGALDRLEKEVAARLEKEPQDALLISDLAASIAETLPPDSYPPVTLAQLRAHAWKDRAQALAYVSRYAEAMEAVERAERQLAAFGTLAHDRALVRYVRAIVLQKTERFDESRRLLAECKAVFQDHGDSRLQLFCGISEGTLLYRRGSFRLAYDVFLPLLEVARDFGDVDSEARIQNNLGHCAAEFDDMQIANVHLSQAMARFTELGKSFEAVRSEMTFGRVLLARGSAAAGIQRLQNARRLFLMHGFMEDAGICGLFVVEAFLSNGASDDAMGLAREIAEQFEDAGLNQRAASAVHYLREAIAARNASVETVRHVRSYIDELKEQPQREFVAM